MKARMIGAKIVPDPPSLTEYEKECMQLYGCLNSFNRGEGVRFHDIKEYCELYRIEDRDEINALVTIMLEIDKCIFNYHQSEQKKAINAANKKMEKAQKKR